MSILTQFAQSYDYNYDTTSNVDPAVAAVAVGGVIVFALITILLGYVVHSYLVSRIFQKAGVETWKAWVPIYNIWIMLELGGQQGFWAVLLLVPFLNIVSLVFMYVAMYHIGLKLGKQGAFVLLAIFISIVWYIWLAFDDSKWPREKVVSPKAVKATATK